MSDPTKHPIPEIEKMQTNGGFEETMTTEESAKEEIVKIARIKKNSLMPKYSTSGSAGMDLICCHECTCKSGERTLIDTGLQIKMPKNTYGRIAPRSSLALKYLDVCAGVVDADFTGELKVLMANNGPDNYTFKAGDKIAQIIYERISRPVVVEETSLNLEREILAEYGKDRRDGGFGSTGN